jgi:hypothetical protein
VISNSFEEFKIRRTRGPNCNIRSRSEAFSVMIRNVAQCRSGESVENSLHTEEIFAVSETCWRDRFSALFSILLGDWMATCVGKIGVRQQIIDRSTTLSVISALLLSIYMPMIFQATKLCNISVDFCVEDPDLLLRCNNFLTYTTVHRKVI